MASNNVTAFTLAVFAISTTPEGIAVTPFAPLQLQQRLIRVQQLNPPGTVAVCRFCARCAKRLAVELTLICKKVSEGGKCTRCTKNGSKYEKVSFLLRCSLALFWREIMLMRCSRSRRSSAACLPASRLLQIICLPILLPLALRLPLPWLLLLLPSGNVLTAFLGARVRIEMWPKLYLLTR